MDTMKLVKIASGVCGAWLVLLLGKWAAEGVYHPHSHGEQSYVIEVADSGGAGGEAEVSFEELMAQADPAKGAKVFKKCTACHKAEDGVNATGPYLYGVVGRDVASAAGFGYSGNLVKVADVWTPENLDGFLASPRSFAPGTTMGFNGLSKAKDRVNLIAYLDSLDD